MYFALGHKISKNANKQQRDEGNAVEILWG
jgi:hypothetical protein